MIKLKNLIENKRNFEIALDMDGVLCDFNKQYIKFLSNDVLFRSVVDHKKAVSNAKLERLGINKQQFIEKAFSLRDEILKTGNPDIYEVFKHRTKEELLVSLAWNVIVFGGELFWSSMDWMEGGRELVKYIKSTGLNTSILTAGMGNSASVGKQQWLSKNDMGNVPFNIVSRGTEKYKFAREDLILIDDMERNITLFVEAGGIGILHTDTKSTIKELETHIL
jgi:hypothetical protein